MELVLRPFQKEDIDPLYFLDQRAYAEPYRFKYAQLVKTLLDRDVVAAVLAEQDEETGKARYIRGAGIFRGEPWKQRLTVLTLMVDPDFQRMGLATKLMDWGYRLGRSYNLRRICCPIERANSGAEAFFEAKGFAPVDEKNSYFSSSEVGRLWMREMPPEPADEPKPPGDAEKTEQPPQTGEEAR